MQLAGTFTNLKINACSPGYVLTDLTAGSAPRRHSRRSRHRALRRPRRRALRLATLTHVRCAPFCRRSGRV